MRTIVTILALLLPLIAFAGEQTVTFKVAGNCGSCKKRIVKAATAVEGVTNPSWDKKTKLFTVQYDDSKTTLDKIKQAIVAAGHDVEDAKSTDEAYSKLPDCCRYRDRTHE